MAQFRYVATDASGQRVKGYIEADSESEAVGRAWRRGLRIEQIEPVMGGRGEPELPEPPRAAPEERPLPSFVAPPASKGKGGDYPWLPTILAGIAVLISLTTLALVYIRTRDGSGLGRGLAAYDISTPEAALRSKYLMQDNRDIRAAIDLQMLREGVPAEGVTPSLKIEKVVTLKPEKEDDEDELRMKRRFGLKDDAPKKKKKPKEHKETKVAFYSFRRKGKTVKKTEGFEYDKETKAWMPAYVSPFRVKKSDPDLAKEMEEWVKDNEEDE